MMWIKRAAPVVMAIVAAVAALDPVAAVTISGKVTNELGQGIPNVDLDFINVATGKPESASGDLTDANGNYLTTIGKLGIYDVYYSAAIGIRYAGHLEPAVNLNSNQTGVNVLLKDAWFVSGDVIRTDTGLGAANVDLDFKDLTNGVKIFTPHDNTDLAGHFNVAVPIGIYEVTFDGPPPAVPTDPPQLAPAHYLELSITGERDIQLPGTLMVLGYVVSGELQDSKGDGIISADLDFIDSATGVTIFTQHDNTDPRGRYSTVVPAGTYDIVYDPPPGVLQPSIMKTAVPILIDTDLGIDVINDGWVVSGFVKDADGHPLRQVDLDFAGAGGGAPIPTAWDKTDSAGHYSIVVPPGTWDISFVSQINSQMDGTLRTSLGVASDTTLTDTILPFHDEDGDGAVDAHDNCPFKATATQADGDGDGWGDACDICPLIADPRQADNDRDALGDLCDPDDDNDGIPDTTDTDDDGDLIADLVDNCPSARNPAQLDRDGDGTGDACDTDDGEVETIRASGKAGFSWAPEGGATGYQVYRQQLEWISSIDFGPCVQDDLQARLFRDPEIPVPGRAFGYLVTAQKVSGPSSLGRRSDLSERPNLRPCP